MAAATVTVPFPLTGRSRATQREWRTAFRRDGERTFSGYVFDPSDPDRKFAVEILVDGHPVKLLRADAYCNALAGAGPADGCFGFSLALPDGAIADGSIVEARVANLRDLVGAPVLLNSSFAATFTGSPGAVRWGGGLRFLGWIAGDAALGSADILVDGVLVAKARAAAWSHVGAPEDGARPVGGLDFHLPERFADGAVHQLQAIDGAGGQLEGSPLTFLAFANGLDATQLAGGGCEANRARAELFNQLMPHSIAMADYRRWRERLPAPPGPLGALSAAVVAIGAGAFDETLASLDAQGEPPWVAAALPPSSEPTGFSPADLRGFLEGDGADSQFILFARSGAVFAPSALARFAGAFEQFGEAQAVYGDVEMQTAGGALWPLALPSFDYERLLEQGYCAWLFALRRAAALSGLAAGVSNLYQMFHSVLDKPNSATAIIHLPLPLAALPPFDKREARTLADATLGLLRRRRVAAAVEPDHSAIFPAARVIRAREAVRVSIVIPTRNHRALLERCLDSIRPAAVGCDVEIIVVDNDSSDPDALDYLEALDKGGASVLRVGGPFNFARLNNRAAAAASGEILCLLNNDVCALDDVWLDEMLGRIADADVGAVGALLLWPSGVVQHGGVTLGPRFEAAHAFCDRIDGEGGYGDLLRVAHECSAVTAACMITRRRDYLELGGMDETHFPVAFNDVDYCLRLRARGRRIVFTPRARLMHRESASRGLDHSADRRPRFERELRNLRAKWGAILAADPYYSPILGLDPNPFSALAWPLRDMGPRLNKPPVENPLPTWL